MADPKTSPRRVHQDVCLRQIQLEYRNFFGMVLSSIRRSLKRSESHRGLEVPVLAGLDPSQS